MKRKVNLFRSFTVVMVLQSHRRLLQKKITILCGAGESTNYLSARYQETAYRASPAS